jgi:hypothetical protein
MAEWHVYALLPKDELNVVLRNQILAYYGNEETLLGERVFLTSFLTQLEGARPVLALAYQNAVLNPGESPLSVLPWEEAAHTRPVHVYASMARARMEAFLHLAGRPNPGLSAALDLYKERLLAAGFPVSALPYTALPFEGETITLASMAANATAAWELDRLVRTVGDMASDVARWHLAQNRPGLGMDVDHRGLLGLFEEALNELAGYAHDRDKCIAVWGKFAQELAKWSGVPLVLNTQVCLSLPNPVEHVYNVSVS